MTLGLPSQVARSFRSLGRRSLGSRLLAAHYHDAHCACCSRGFASRGRIHYEDDDVLIGTGKSPRSRGKAAGGKSASASQHQTHADKQLQDSHRTVRSVQHGKSGRSGRKAAAAAASAAAEGAAAWDATSTGVQPWRQAEKKASTSADFPVKIDVKNGVPVYIYTDDIDEKTRQQLVNLARSPMPVGHVAAMPDVHLGKGATIGSVFASKDYVCPNAVGVDIGCGMCAVPVEGPLYRRDLSEQKLLSIQRGLRSSIPTGFESHDRSTREMEKTLDRLVSEHKPTRWLRQTLSGKHTKQIGTLGGGNHFVELVYDEEDRVWMMLHSGSRNIGNVTAQHYDGVAAKQCDGKKEALAYLKIQSKEGQEYLTDMGFCQSYALENRRFMMEAFRNVLKGETGKDALWDRMVNIHHNYQEGRHQREARPAWNHSRKHGHRILHREG
eukprot:TRINITY_DN50250_c0_g1_i2.p1 TRINITY_DN50250_c0_g1~~TRINITY_DN50250_c0_g1_i2.p1  ORF type:complete len:440 (+),score=81.47 TRINITY_DN50250_c0_g1_i2:71-1390(+)